jgi:carbamoyl-phosphate synthase large subunit
MYKTKNILISSAGRRVELIQLFKKAIKAQKKRIKVIAIDVSSTAPSAKFADEFLLVPRIEDKEFFEKILEIVKNYNVGLIVPTIDTELLFYSHNKEFFLKEYNCLVLTPEEELVKIFRDKRLTHQYLDKLGFNSPNILNLNNLKSFDFPVFIKPAKGSSSIGAHKVNDMEELKFYLKHINEPLVQEYIEGTEYSIDVFSHFQKRIVSIVIRERLAIRSGEILKGKIVEDSIIFSTVKKLVSTFQFIGNLTIQVFKSKNKVFIIEINPRFGGGTPLSIMAGADSCKFAIDMMLGKSLLKKPKIKKNIIFSRFDQTIQI